MSLKKKMLASKLQPKSRSQINPVLVQLTPQKPVAMETTQSTKPTEEENKYKVVMLISE